MHSSRQELHQCMTQKRDTPMRGCGVRRTTGLGWSTVRQFQERRSQSSSNHGGSANRSAMRGSFHLRGFVDGQPVRRDVLAKWLRQAERKAGLPKLDGSLWHAYRRGWATSRKNLPTLDEAAAGGWNYMGTLLLCYQQPDNATMLAVMSHEARPVEQQERGLVRGQTDAKQAPAFCKCMERTGIEPATSWLQTRRSPS